MRLLDLISQPPADGKYKELRDRLIATFGLSGRERASHLLHFYPLGNSKPSALMDEMLGLLGDHPPCLLFEQLFLERLPEDICIQLVDFKFEDLCKLANRADALWSCREMTSLGDIMRCKPPAGEMTRPQTHAPSQEILCYYLRRFGRTTQQCGQPCPWSGR